MTFFINNIPYEIKKYDLIFIDKNTFHRSLYKNNEKERIIIMFRKDIFDIIADNEPLYKIIQLLSCKQVLSFDEKTKSDIIDMLNKMLSIYERNKEEDLYSLKIMLSSFLVSLKIYIDEGSLLPNVIIKSKNNKLVTDIINYINSHYNDKLTLSLLADKLYINKHHLCHAFKKITGITIIDFINNKRLTEAKRLLKSSDYSITNISSMHGRLPKPKLL